MRGLRCCGSRGILAKAHVHDRVGGGIDGHLTRSHGGESQGDSVDSEGDDQFWDNVSVRMFVSCI